MEGQKLILPNKCESGFFHCCQHFFFGKVPKVLIKKTFYTDGFISFYWGIGVWDFKKIEMNFKGLCPSFMRLVQVFLGEL